METKQTAVEWLVWELNKLGFFPNGVPQETYEQAKEMEKQQIIDANLNGQAEFDKGEFREEVMINA